jgi:hypothetical protein
MTSPQLLSRTLPLLLLLPCALPPLPLLLLG